MNKILAKPLALVFAVCLFVKELNSNRNFFTKTKNTITEACL